MGGTEEDTFRTFPQKLLVAGSIEHTISNWLNGGDTTVTSTPGEKSRASFQAFAPDALTQGQAFQLFLSALPNSQLAASLNASLLEQQHAQGTPQRVRGAPHGTGNKTRPTRPHPKLTPTTTCA